jgi:hypothetical protein
MTRTGQPASVSRRIAASRRAGAGTRGSIRRDSVGIERRDRDADARQPHAPHLAQDVGVALDQRALGDDRHRVAMVAQHLEQARMMRWSFSIGW